MTTKQRLATTTKRAMARARVAGKLVTKRLIAAADAELVKQGKAARARIRKRAAQAAFKKMAKRVAIAGAAAATMVAVRASVRAVRRRAALTT